jgi:long-subunit fatty acid transport protein
LTYESSPVSDRHRTLDLPFEELYKLSFAYTWKGHKDLDFSLGSTVYLIGDARIDQTSQGVRTKGKYDTNYIVFFGGTPTPVLVTAEQRTSVNRGQGPLLLVYLCA